MYGVREHQIFQQPLKVNLGKTIHKAVPEGWQGYIKETKVEVVPLVNNTSKDYPTGWITYSDDFIECPDVEMFAGGYNVKHPKAAAWWRQGNLLHFGFEQSPAELNETGQAMLLNSIAYIVQFTEDIPIANTPSVFTGPYPRSRASVSNVIHNASRKLDDLDYYAAPSVMTALKGKDRPACKAWFAENGRFLHPGVEGKLAVDEEVKAFGVPCDTAAFFDKAIAALGESGETRARARRLLVRYVPDGPSGGVAKAWEAWWRENRSYVFFSQAGEYRWYLDSLAKKRGVPTAELTGPKRADRKL